ncbi:MAG: alpha/beta hydrolase [Bacteroidales bacterium]|nr:alpha/beta hydrolase [Bacteroidales bacterium]
MKRNFVILMLSLPVIAAHAQQEIFLYADRQEQSSAPSVTVWLPEPEKASGKSVIVCPGGGYAGLVTEREGHRVAREFNKAGIAAFVLKYRLPERTKAVDQSSYPLQDAQTAIKIIRQRAQEWNIDTSKLGIMGFSAGGHLASTAGTHYADPVIDNAENVNLRPDFMILVYPVISFSDPLAHAGSRTNLLGASPAPEKIAAYSNELHVNAATPPTFLTHANDDAVVPVANSIVFYEALTRNKVLAELHVYAQGGHGYSRTPPFEEWFGRCLFWLNAHF